VTPVLRNLYVDTMKEITLVQFTSSSDLMVLIFLSFCFMLLKFINIIVKVLYHDSDF